MTRPRLSVYNEVSIDGRVGGFDQDPLRYYRFGFRWRSDAILMGSVTAQNFGPAESSREQAMVLPTPDKLPIVDGFADLVYEPRPLLVVPDSRGTLRNWTHALMQPWYRSIVVLVTASTPLAYLEYLKRRRIDYLIVGDDRVELPAALERLSADYGVTSIRTDSGGALNGALLAAGLVDEIGLIVNPTISGQQSPSLIELPHALSNNGLPLTLIDVGRLNNGAVWLLYETRAAGGVTDQLSDTHSCLVPPADDLAVDEPGQRNVVAGCAGGGGSKPGSQRRSSGATGTVARS